MRVRKVLTAKSWQDRVPRLEAGSTSSAVLRLGMFLLALLLLPWTASAEGWKAGVGRANITPPEPMPMAGYASRGSKHAEGKLTDLWAKALVLEDAHGKQVALITLDLVGIDQGLSRQICEQLEQQQHWKRDQIALCTSHTHTGPVVAKTLRPMHYALLSESDRALVDQYAEFLSKSVIQAVETAVKDCRPADVSWGSGRATFAVNRRENKEPDVPQLKKEGKLKGPSDHDVPVLVVKQGKQIKAIACGYACHSTTLGSMEWSGDYPGFAQIDLEKKYPGCQAMFWAGCGGDQNPLPRRTVELAKDYGHQLAQAVEQVVDGMLKPLRPSLKTAYEEIDLPLGKLPTREEIQTDSASTNQYVAARGKYLLHELSQGHPLPTKYPYPVEVWKLGDAITFVFLSGEVVVDYAIRIKEELGANSDSTNIWCAGYSNDVMAYIPSQRVLLEGGYEGGGAMVYYGLPTIWAPSVEEDIMHAVKETVAKVNTP